MLLHCYALGTLFVSSKMRDAAAAAAEPGAAGTDRIIQQLTREMAAAKAADGGEAD